LAVTSSEILSVFSEQVEWESDISSWWGITHILVFKLL